VETSPSARAAGTRAGRRRLGDVLLSQGVLTPEQLQAALAEQERRPRSDGHRRRLGQLLVEMELLSERELVDALAAALGYEVVDPNRTAVDREIARSLPRQVAERYLAVPLEMVDGRLRVALADPTDVVALDDIRMYTGAQALDVTVALESHVRDALARIWSLAEDSSRIATMIEGLDAEAPEAQDASPVDTAPTVQLVNGILSDAIRLGASDIHVEPQQSDVRIRYRVDGLLRDVMSVPRAASAGLTSRVKVMANLDIAERRLPQDGRTRLNLDGHTVDARVSTLPGIHGEKVAIRLLSRSEQVSPLSGIGLDPTQLEVLQGALASPQGLVLITGPTGSGKTNTLYSAISVVRAPELNVVTLEDPVEIQLPGITQVQINERGGLTFARGLRSVLRQDPDVILVGEVRDEETAKLALEASLTGHLVLTTLHTNSAPAALSRLIDMGVEPYLVASALSVIIAQRLVRKVCAACAEPYVPSPHTMELLGLDEAALAAGSAQRGRGCPKCDNTGYRGRTGVFQVMPVTAAMRALVRGVPTEDLVAAAARDIGASTLRESAVAKALRGVTTFEEVLRATPEVVIDRPTAPPVRVDPVRAEPVSPRRPRILVVDADPAACSYVHVTLLEHADVYAVGTAQEAFTVLQDGSYQAAIIDEHLPDWRGVELLAQLRASPVTAALPVMLLTGLDDPAVAAAARAAGANDVVLKPADPLVLEERVFSLTAAAPAADPASPEAAA
jgi:type IV pilus assembly protein PilB